MHIDNVIFGSSGMGKYIKKTWKRRDEQRYIWISDRQKPLTISQNYFSRKAIRRSLCYRFCNIHPPLHALHVSLHVETKQANDTLGGLANLVCMLQNLYRSQLQAIIIVWKNKCLTAWEEPSSLQALSTCMQQRLRTHNQLIQLSRSKITQVCVNRRYTLRAWWGRHNCTAQKHSRFWL